MKKWSNMLLPVLDQFVATSEGRVDKAWWNQIANYVGGGSGMINFYLLLLLF